MPGIDTSSARHPGAFFGIYIDIWNGANPLMNLKYWWHNRKADFTTRTHHLNHIQGEFVSNGFRIVSHFRVGRQIPFGTWAILIEAERL